MKTRWLGSMLASATLASFAACSSNSNHDVTVNWSDMKQPIDGFGASSVFFGGSITEDQADLLFDAKKGIGLSLLRTQIGLPSDIQSDGSEPTTDTNPMPTAPEIATAKQAYARGCKIWAAAWTPPPVWKTTNSKNGSGTGGDAGDAGPTFTSNKLLQAHYQDYANYLANFMQQMTAANIPIVALSPANEPDYVATWDNAQWAPDELTMFIGQNLGPTLNKSWPSLKIVAPETANCPGCDPFVTSILADPTASSFVPTIAVHGYSSNGALVYDKPRNAGKAFWETEWSEENKSGHDVPDPTMVSAIDVANHIHDYMVTTQVNAWNYWAIYHDATNLNDPVRMNPALIQPAIEDGGLGAPFMFRRGYAIGNWSKFVRPGFVRIGATDHPVSGELVEAYRDSTHLAIIAVNTTSNAITQTFHISGSTFGSVTPWITSADLPLVAQTAITATDHFSFELPAMSVVSFVNWDATTETPGEVPVGTTTTDGGGVDGSGPMGDGGLVTSPCTASAAGLTLIDNGSSGMGSQISFSPTFAPAGCGTTGSWGNFATNSGTIMPSPFTFEPLPPGLPDDAGATASTGDATLSAGPQATCMTGTTGLPQYSTSGIGFNFVQGVAPTVDAGSMSGGANDGSSSAGDGSAESGAVSDDGSAEGGADGGDDSGVASDDGGAGNTDAGAGSTDAGGTAPAPTPAGPATLDASSHTGIQFWAWGGSELASQSILVVLRDINQTFGFGPAGAPTATGTLCNGGTDGVGSGPTACGGDRTSETLTPGWQLVSIPFKSFIPISGYSTGNGEVKLDPSTLTRFELQVQLTAASADAGVPYDLCIYGLSFY